MYTVCIDIYISIYIYIYITAGIWQAAILALAGVVRLCRLLGDAEATVQQVAGQLAVPKFDTRTV